MLARKIKKLKFGVYLVAGNENEKNKLMELFSSYNIKNATFVTGPLDTGFISNDLNIAIFTEGDLTQKGKQHYHGIQESISSAFITNFRELKSGDLIVHKQFGIGRYNGLKKIRVKSVETDYLECEYSGSDKIFVPVQNLKLIQKYVGDNKIQLRGNSRPGKDNRRSVFRYGIPQTYGQAYLR